MNKKENVVISIVMLAYNAEKYIREAMDSIVCQSFTDFECIIIDDGSTDNTCDIVRTYDDERIILIENKHDFIGSLNLGVETARGKYIARMDADDIMHPDRLKIQHSIMEAEPSITVCSTWMKQFGDGVPAGSIASSLSGLVELPLLTLTRGSFVFHPTTVIRRSFLAEQHIQYENYPYAEDLKLWTEIAKRGGVFYVDNQLLLNYRISETQVSNQKREEQKNTTELIMFEIIDYLLDNNKENYPELLDNFESLIKLQEKSLITFYDTLEILRKIFITNKNKLLLA
jgi:glycosyltransferase involved in cell wall biosynthesis